MIYDNDIMQAGIWRISDLFDSNKKFISFRTLELRGVPKAKYLLWQCIVTITKKLKVTLKKPEDVNDLEVKLTTNEIINIKDLGSKDSYNKIVKLKCEKPKSIDKYALTFNISNVEHFKNVYVIPHLCTKDNLCKDLQYQILHRYLPTNYLLHKMNKTSTMRCTFCEIHIESIPHLFFHCINIKVIWVAICKIMEKIEDKKVVLRCQDVLFGLGFENNNWKKNVFFNNVILYVKSFIWNSRKHGTVINLQLLKRWFQEKAITDGNLETVSQELACIF